MPKKKQPGALARNFYEKQVAILFLLFFSVERVEN